MLELLRKFRTVFLAGCLLLIALLVYSANLKSRASTNLFERAVLQVTAPLQEVVNVGRDQIVGAWDYYFWLVNTSKENDLLLLENRRLKAELEVLQEVRLTNERLRRLLGFTQEVDLPALPAQVIAEDASSWFRTVVINKGTEDGAVEGLPVVVSEGVVGRIIKSAPRHSRVLLVTDASSAAASLVQRTRTRGVARGMGESLTLDFALRQEDIHEGDRVITSGMGGVFPKGLTVGKVTRVVRGEFGLFQEVEVQPAVDFSRLEEVLVLLRKDP